MRVVAGTAGGLRLVAPTGQDTRPTSDRAREATFNSLGSLGVVEDATVLDLFAGSGAMGIEALSRGALQATFVDNDERALRAIRANLTATKLADRATVVAADAFTFLGTAGRHFDIAVLDPPYAFDRWSDVMAELPAGVAVLESDRPIDPGEGWTVVRTRRYGTTVVTICRRSSDPQENLT
ncbi:MAG: rRNA (guanine966-N2)-methyltransferase [Acidimicrobiaceae bacterium]|jgi:16S rRNA (guanine966-N2)-methyltransferase